MNDDKKKPLTPKPASDKTGAKPPAAKETNAPIVQLTPMQMIAVCGGLAVLSLGAFFIEPILSFAFLAMTMAVVTFGFLKSTATVNNAWGQFGSAAAVAIVTFLICLTFFQRSNLEIRGNVWVQQAGREKLLVKRGRIDLTDQGLLSKAVPNPDQPNINDKGFYSIQGVKAAVGDSLTFLVKVDAPINIEEKTVTGQVGKDGKIDVTINADDFEFVAVMSAIVKPLIDDFKDGGNTATSFQEGDEVAILFEESKAQLIKSEGVISTLILKEKIGTTDFRFKFKFATNRNTPLEVPNGTVKLTAKIKQLPTIDRDSKRVTITLDDCKIQPD